VRIQGAEIDVGVGSFPQVAQVSLRGRVARVSGRWGPVLAWLSQTVADAAGAASVWDPQEGAPLRDAPSWDEVLAQVRQAERERDGEPLPVPKLPSPTESAAQFLQMLEARRLIELAPERQALAAELGRLLSGPEEGRAERLEALLLDHSAVLELFTDLETLEALLKEWG